MTESDRHHWETRYTAGKMPIHASPNRWLVTQAAFLDKMTAASPLPRLALDVACGAGGTLVWLTQRGWQVTDADISAAALARARTQLDAAALLDNAILIEAGLDIWRPCAASNDLITCFNFLDRRLWPALCTAVRPHGLISLQTYHTGRLVDRPESNPAHLLAPGELAAVVTA